ncbi:MAG: nicotinamide mononucleotide transporter [Gammaproteobacteria bacterium]|nr:nicotinamide mononucleotide transporter [Gammaproteobacteria bacterium]
MPSTQSLELFATLAGFLNIILCIRANIWNWFFGIVMVVLYAVVFYQTKLYADMGFQCVALVLQFYGLKRWSEKLKLEPTPLKITPKKIWWIALSSTMVLFGAIAFLLARYTDSNTVLIDAATTAGSLVALWMQANAWIGHWLLWIVVCSASVEMYLIKNLYYTAGLFFIFIILNGFGFYRWRAQLRLTKENW